jgi:homoserine dehydrogenase
VMADVARFLGDAGISIEAILQKEPAPGVTQASIILLTHVVQERQMNAAITRIEALDSIHGEVTRIRLEHLNVY